jgi:hypothetical protein
MSERSLSARFLVTSLRGTPLTLAAAQGFRSAATLRVPLVNLLPISVMVGLST